jgi:hypothetical protein
MCMFYIYTRKTLTQHGKTGAENETGHAHTGYRLHTNVYRADKHGIRHLNEGTCGHRMRQ